MGVEEQTLDTSREGIHLEYESNEDLYILFYIFYDSSALFFFFFFKKVLQIHIAVQNRSKEERSPENGT